MKLVYKILLVCIITAFSTTTTIFSKRTMKKRECKQDKETVENPYGVKKVLRCGAGALDHCKRYETSKGKYECLENCESFTFEACPSYCKQLNSKCNQKLKIGNVLPVKKPKSNPKLY